MKEDLGSMKIQIYEHSHPDDVRASVCAGVDFIGVKPGMAGQSPGEVSFDVCRDLFAAAGAAGGCLRVALTVSTDLNEVSATVRTVRPDVIHLSGDIEDMDPTGVGRLRSELAGVKVMLAVPVRDTADAETAKEFESAIDYMLLDTVREDGVAGATGLTHDWNISATIVRAVHVPVILAGGLHPGNVREAIRLVKPWGVDSFSHTNLPDSRRKDAAKVADFVAQSRGVF